MNQKIQKNQIQITQIPIILIQTIQNLIIQMIQTTQIQFDDTRVTSLKVRLKPACRRSFKFVPGNAKHSDGRTRV